MNCVKVHFVVCSDEPQWVRTNLVVARRWEGQVSVVEGQEPVGDLALLALCCEHSIITVGSFGWWTAYLRSACRMRWLSHNSAANNSETLTGGRMIEGETFYYAGFCRDPTTKYYQIYCANGRLLQHIPSGWRSYG